MIFPRESENDFAYIIAFAARRMSRTRRYHFSRAAAGARAPKARRCSPMRNGEQIFTRLTHSTARYCRRRRAAANTTPLERRAGQSGAHFFFFFRAFSLLQSCRAARTKLLAVGFRLIDGARDYEWRAIFTLAGRRPRVAAHQD